MGRRGGLRDGAAARAGLRIDALQWPARRQGEPLVALLQKCGEPVFRQAVCVPMLQLGWVALPYRPYGPGAVLANQCVPMEEWTYDRGDGNFLGVVRVHNGTIESVRSGPRLR